MIASKFRKEVRYFKRVMEHRERIRQVYIDWFCIEFDPLSLGERGFGAFIECPFCFCTVI